MVLRAITPCRFTGDILSTCVYIALYAHSGGRFSEDPFAGYYYTLTALSCIHIRNPGNVFEVLPLTWTFGLYIVIREFAARAREFCCTRRAVL